MCDPFNWSTPTQFQNLTKRVKSIVFQNTHFKHSTVQQTSPTQINKQVQALGNHQPLNMPKKAAASSDHHHHHHDEGRASSSSSAPSVPECVLDSSVLNKRTVYNMTDMGLSIFAVLCGQNRGAFVLSNYTYSCLQLPEAFAVRAGIDSNDVTIATANDISECVIGCFCCLL